MSEVYLYQDMSLTEGFDFPSKLVLALNQDPVPYPKPWWYILEYPELARKWLPMARKDYPTRNLIPFAGAEFNDDVACFDGEDHSGNPRVFIVHFGASSGWEHVDTLDNYEAWLKLVEKHAREYNDDD